MQTHQKSSFFLKAQTRTHSSGKPIRSLSRHPAQIPQPDHAPAAPASPLRAAPPRAGARPLPQPGLRARQLPLPRLHTSQAPLQPSARASSQASARQLPRPGLRAAPLPRTGSPAPALRPARARAAAREGGAEVDLGLDFSGEWNREQRGNNQRREDRGRVKESIYNQLEASQLYFNGKTNSSGM